MNAIESELRLAEQEVLFLTALFRHVSEYMDKHSTIPYLCVMIEDVVEIDSSFLDVAECYLKKIAGMLGANQCRLTPPLLSPKSNIIRRYFRLGVVYQWLQGAHHRVYTAKMKVEFSLEQGTTDTTEMTLTLPKETVNFIESISQLSGVGTDSVFNVILALHINGQKANKA